jgi:hypothetical protein
MSDLESRQTLKQYWKRPRRIKRSSKMKKKRLSEKK